MAPSLRTLLAFHQDSYEEHVQYHAICEPFYHSFIIPTYDNDIKYLLVLSALELLIVLFLWLVLAIKKYYIFVEKNVNKAKAILLPYYDRIVYYYSFIAIYRMILSLIQFALVRQTNIDDVEHVWYMAAMAYISSLCIISLELFIAFLIMQASVGRNAFRRAFQRTLALCVILALFMLAQTIWGSRDDQFIVGLIFSILIHGTLLCTYIAIFCYAFIYQQNVMKMRRARNKILYIYLLSIGFIHCIYTVSFILELTKVDGFCFIIFGEYLYRIIFPIVAYITIKNDSKFWKNIIYSMQLVSNTSMAHMEIDDDHFELASSVMHDDSGELDGAAVSSADTMILSGKYYRSTIKSVFGDDRHYGPIIAALELEINMINYEDLHDLSDPFAMGTTSFVHRAKWKGQDVAVKKWLFDEIDLSLESLQEFFRETLFSNIPHPNLVQFKGACLRPPELCLVYEYVNCGDLAVLILPQYSNNVPPRHRDAIKMKHRLHILMGIAQGMAKLHQEGIIHRDLKTSNVLVKYDERQQIYIGKVCDFGSARKLESVQREAASSISAVQKKPARYSLLNAFKHQSGELEQPHELSDMLLNSSMQTTLSTATSRSRMTTQVGTIAFMAPELLSKIDVIKLLPPDQRRKLEKQSAAAAKARFLDIDSNKNSYQLLTDEEQQEQRKHSGGLIATKWSRKGTASSDSSQRSASKTPREFLRSLTNKLISREEEVIQDHHATNTYTFSFAIESKQNEENDPDFGGLTSMYDKSIDIFAFGVLMFEVGFRRRIYEEMDVMDIYNIVTKNKRMPVPSYQECQYSKLNGFYVVSDVVYDEYVKLMRECWSQNAEDRPSFEVIRSRLDDIEHLRSGQ